MSEKAVRPRQGARGVAQGAKEIARQKNQLDAAPLVGKLSSCTGRNAAAERAVHRGGRFAPAAAPNRGSDRRFQAILPLRGKPLNVEKKRLDQVLAE